MVFWCKIDKPFNHWSFCRTFPEKGWCSLLLCSDHKLWLAACLSEAHEKQLFIRKINCNLFDPNWLRWWSGLFCCNCVIFKPTFPKLESVHAFRKHEKAQYCLCSKSYDLSSSSLFSFLDLLSCIAYLIHVFAPILPHFFMKLCTTASGKILFFSKLQIQEKNFFVWYVVHAQM